MFFLAGVGLGAWLLHQSHAETKQSWYAETDARAAGHVKQARIYKVLGWGLIGLFVLAPLAFIALFTLFPPEFTF